VFAFLLEENFLPHSTLFARGHGKLFFSCGMLMKVVGGMNVSSAQQKRAAERAAE
jgi:hypothetical protein